MINFIFKIFFAMPFLLRVVLFLLIVLGLWRLIGKRLLWVLSFIPFVLEKIFIVLYQIIEVPITVFHKKFGAAFYKADKIAAEFGKKVDRMLNCWYNVWHSQYKFVWWKAIAVYFLCLIIIVAPSFLSLESNLLKAGETLYLSGENNVKELLEKHRGYNLARNVFADQKPQPDKESAKAQNQETELVVANVSSSLLVRDIPDMSNSTALERLHNGDTVVWTGDMVFAEAENDHIETWARIRTQSGIEGWSRLFYLHPVEYKDVKFYVENKIPENQQE